MQNSAWAKTVRSQRAQFTTFRKGVVTHSTIDNNDGRQDTHTGSGTTHDTNKTIFQVPSIDELNSIPVIGNAEMALDIIDDTSNETTVGHSSSTSIHYYP